MRTDANIRLDVESELRWEPSLDEKGILVKVEGGVVSLQGSVPHFSDRGSAEDVTKRVVGVRATSDIKPVVKQGTVTLSGECRAATRRASRRGPYAI
jgi:osmotically-inducible protein OsmY